MASQVQCIPHSFRHEALVLVMASLARHILYNCRHETLILVMASLVRHIPYNCYLYVRIDIKCQPIHLASQ
jgi:hypothetical protein